MSEKMFPLQAPRRGSDTKPHPLQIPWPVAEKAYSVYAGLYGKSQSLERLAERGGFSGGEMDQLYPEWRDEVSEIAALRSALTARETELAEAKQRVAKLEGGIRFILKSPFLTLNTFVRSDGVAANLVALLPADRITHIPGKEDDDGEMH